MDKYYRAEMELGIILAILEKFLWWNRTVFFNHKIMWVRMQFSPILI